jgi:2-polyprenyl-3-methyl-5-hydroxy-6-metoxy-1,4-benzoquinol methylase
MADEYFIPPSGLDLQPYIDKGDWCAIHHLIRYLWALQCISDFVEIRTVLDVACGAGYGSFEIAKRFPDISVVGVDYDRQAIELARRTYLLPNLKYKVGNVMQWEQTIGQDIFDCIVSFDTIEHIDHREIMMENLVDHLDEDGIVFLSTPSAGDVNELSPQWDSHKIEYSAKSLYDFVKRYFEVIYRPDAEDYLLPHLEVFDRLNDTEISYLLRMNPVLCRYPIKVSNPYPSHVPSPTLKSEKPDYVAQLAASEDGERITPSYPNDCYYAHLSVYHFASRFCKDATVLDAGSGTGYGSAYLAEHGAKFVYGIDLSEVAVAFSQQHFELPNVQFQVMSLGDIAGFQFHQFDLIVTSNVLEHVGGVQTFLRKAWELLKPDGCMIVTVPPVTGERAREHELSNPFHRNIWSPRQWMYVLRMYFEEVQPYLHGFGRTDIYLDFYNTPEQSHTKQISEKDFTFEPVTIDAVRSDTSLSATFLVAQPRQETTLPSLEVPLDFVDDSFSRQLSPAKMTSEAVQEENTRPVPEVFFKELTYLIHRMWSIFGEEGASDLVSEAVSYLKWRLQLLSEKHDGFALILKWAVIFVSLQSVLLIFLFLGWLRCLSHERA